MPRIGYEEWHEIDGLISESSNPYQFWPKLDSKALQESQDSQKKMLGQVYEASLKLTSEFLRQKKDIESSPLYSEKGRKLELQRLIGEYQERLEGLEKDGIGHLREVASARIASAEAEVMPKPQEGWEMMLAKHSLETAQREGWGFQEISQASPFTQRVIALAEPEHSGLNPEIHKLVYRQAAESEGGPLAPASEFSSQVEETGKALKYAQVTMEKAAGLKPSHPQAVKGREMRAELESRKVDAGSEEPILQASASGE